jgi:hypothetical protein
MSITSTSTSTIPALQARI